MTAIHNLFIDKYKNENFTINPLPNGLSDHDAQVLVLNNIKIQNSSTYPIIRRDINLLYLNLSYILVTNLGTVSSVMIMWTKYSVSFSIPT